MLCRVNRSGKNPIEDRLNGFISGLRTDSPETPFFTRTSPLHDQMSRFAGIPLLFDFAALALAANEVVVRVAFDDFVADMHGRPPSFARCRHGL